MMQHYNYSVGWGMRCTIEKCLVNSKALPKIFKENLTRVIELYFTGPYILLCIYCTIKPLYLLA